MIDPKQSREKKITEIEMAIVINRLRSEIQRLQELNSADQPRLAADIVLDVFPAKHDNNLE